MATTATNPWESVDRRLWSGLLLGPVAAGINTIVGFTVSHYACETRGKASLFAVMAVDLVLCALGIWLANSTRPAVASPEDPAIPQDRRIFMLNMAIGMCLFCALLTIAGTLAVVILQPCD